MRLVLRSLPQMVVMAAIVATSLLVPAGAILALLGFAFFGLSFQGFITFGGAIGTAAGLVLWWGVLLVPSLVYAAYMMPWDAKD